MTETPGNKVLLKKMHPVQAYGAEYRGVTVVLLSLIVVLLLPTLTGCVFLRGRLVGVVSVMRRG